MKRLPEHLDFETINEIIHVQIIISLLSHKARSQVPHSTENIQFKAAHCKMPHQSDILWCKAFQTG